MKHSKIIKGIVKVLGVMTLSLSLVGCKVATETQKPQYTKVENVKVADIETVSHYRSSPTYKVTFTKGKDIKFDLDVLEESQMNFMKKGYKVTVYYSPETSELQKVELPDISEDTKDTPKQTVEPKDNQEAKEPTKTDK